MRTISHWPNGLRLGMRLLFMVLFLLSQAGCTAMLLGGAQSGETQRSCEEYPDQKHCD